MWADERWSHITQVQKHACSIQNEPLMIDDLSGGSILDNLNFNRKPEEAEESTMTTYSTKSPKGRRSSKNKRVKKVNQTGPIKARNSKRKGLATNGGKKKQELCRLRKRQLAMKGSYKSGLISDGVVLQLILTNDLRENESTNYFAPVPLDFNPDAQLKLDKHGKKALNGELKRDPEQVVAIKKAAAASKLKVKPRKSTEDELLKRKMQLDSRTPSTHWTSSSDIPTKVRYKAREAKRTSLLLEEAYGINRKLNNFAEKMVKINIDRLTVRAKNRNKVVVEGKIVNVITNARDRGDLLLLWNAKQSMAFDKRMQRRNSAAITKAAIGDKIVLTLSGQSPRLVPVHSITEGMKVFNTDVAKKYANAMVAECRHTILTDLSNDKFERDSYTNRPDKARRVEDKRIKALTVANLGHGVKKVEFTTIVTKSIPDQISLDTVSVTKQLNKDRLVVVRSGLCKVKAEVKAARVAVAKDNAKKAYEAKWIAIREAEALAAHNEAVRSEEVALMEAIHKEALKMNHPNGENTHSHVITLKQIRFRRGQ